MKLEKSHSGSGSSDVDNKMVTLLKSGYPQELEIVSDFSWDEYNDDIIFVMWSCNIKNESLFGDIYAKTAYKVSEKETEPDISDLEKIIESVYSDMIKECNEKLEKYKSYFTIAALNPDENHQLALVLAQTLSGEPHS